VVVPGSASVSKSVALRINDPDDENDDEDEELRQSNPGEHMYPFAPDAAARSARRTPSGVGCLFCDLAALFRREAFSSRDPAFATKTHGCLVFTFVSLT
jgi:hypothetical protein